MGYIKTKCSFVNHGYVHNFSLIQGVAHNLELPGGSSVWNQVEQYGGRGKERQVRRFSHEGQGTSWLQGELIFETRWKRGSSCVEN